MTGQPIICGDCRTALRDLPDQRVQCCVTSPPYWGLRSYLLKDHPDKAREIGSEATPEAFVETMVQVFREVRRVSIAFRRSGRSRPPSCKALAPRLASPLQVVRPD